MKVVLLFDIIYWLREVIDKGNLLFVLLVFYIFCLRFFKMNIFDLLKIRNCVFIIKWKLEFFKIVLIMEFCGIKGC